MFLDCDYGPVVPGIVLWVVEQTQHPINQIVEFGIVVGTLAQNREDLRQPIQ
jgi:hypothetical protein